MLYDNFIDLESIELNLYNYHMYVGATGSEGEDFILGGIQHIYNTSDSIDFCGIVTESRISYENRNLRYDFSLVRWNPSHTKRGIFLRIEMNGSPHFWKSFDMTIDDFNRYTKDYYTKVSSSKVPVVAINMCILGTGSDKNRCRREALHKLVQDGILEQAIYSAKTLNRNININLRDKDLIPAPTKTNNDKVNQMLLDILTRPDYLVKVC